MNKLLTGVVTLVDDLMQKPETTTIRSEADECNAVGDMYTIEIGQGSVKLSSTPSFKVDGECSLLFKISGSGVKADSSSPLLDIAFEPLGENSLTLKLSNINLNLDFEAHCGDHMVQSLTALYANHMGSISTWGNALILALAPVIIPMIPVICTTVMPISGTVGLLPVVIAVDVNFGNDGVQISNPYSYVVFQPLKLKALKGVSVVMGKTWQDIYMNNYQEKIQNAITSAMNPEVINPMLESLFNYAGLRTNMRFSFDSMASQLMPNLNSYISTSAKLGNDVGVDSGDPLPSDAFAVFGDDHAPDLSMLVSHGAFTALLAQPIVISSFDSLAELEGALPAALLTILGALPEQCKSMVEGALGSDDDYQLTFAAQEGTWVSFDEGKLTLPVELQLSGTSPNSTAPFNVLTIKLTLAVGVDLAMTTISDAATSPPPAPSPSMDPPTGTSIAPALAPSSVATQSRRALFLIDGKCKKSNAASNEGNQYCSEPTPYCTCAAKGSTSCGMARCTSGQVGASCDTDSGCRGTVCQNNVCTLVPDGGACTTASVCASGICLQADGSPVPTDASQTGSCSEAPSPPPPSPPGSSPLSDWVDHAKELLAPKSKLSIQLQPLHISDLELVVTSGACSKMTQALDMVDPVVVTIVNLLLRQATQLLNVPLSKLSIPVPFNAPQDATAYKLYKTDEYMAFGIGHFEPRPAPPSTFASFCPTVVENPQDPNHLVTHYYIQTSILSPYGTLYPDPYPAATPFNKNGIADLYGCTVPGCLCRTPLARANNNVAGPSVAWPLDGHAGSCCEINSLATPGTTLQVELCKLGGAGNQDAKCVAGAEYTIPPLPATKSLTADDSGTYYEDLSLTLKTQQGKSSTFSGRLYRTA